MATVSNNSPQSGAGDTNQGTRRDRRAAHTEPSESQVMAEAAAIYPDTSPAAPTPDEIAAEAYAIYMARGGDDGRHEEDWLEAERRLAERRPTNRRQANER